MTKLWTFDRCTTATVTRVRAYQWRRKASGAENYRKHVRGIRWWVECNQHSLTRCIFFKRSKCVTVKQPHRARNWFKLSRWVAVFIWLCTKCELPDEQDAGVLNPTRTPSAAIKYEEL